LNLNNPGHEVSGFSVADDSETNNLQFEKPAIATTTPKEFDFNNPGIQPGD
jgi:hypothetical protein